LSLLSTDFVVVAEEEEAFELFFLFSSFAAATPAVS